MRSDSLVVDHYINHTIEISYKRLPEILKPGDIIYGYDSKIKASFHKIYFIVTHVAWWGVMAVPSRETFEYLGSRANEMKGHQKFKWCNITGFRAVD